jgi:leucyl aminopeptidase (aminopeptidase T)
MGSWGLTEEGLHRAQQRAWDAMAALEGVEKVRVTSPKGTDFTVTIKDRPALEVTSIKRRGQMMGPLPLWAEVAFAAVEDGTDGTMVVDGVMLGIGLPGQVKEPITWTLEKGRAVKIEGGEEARRLREVIEGVENADVIGEFAFGVSEIAPFGTPSEKGRVGTVHCALGDNHNAYPGGQNVSVLHLDGVVLEASMQIVDNGRWILKDGQWVL